MGIVFVAEQKQDGLYSYTLKISYKYETEGYNLDGLWYLPDFWLPNNDCWIEVKGKEPDEEEVEKLVEWQPFIRNLSIFFGEMFGMMSVFGNLNAR